MNNNVLIVIFEVLKLVLFLVGISYTYNLGKKDGALLILNNLGDWNPSVKSEFMKHVFSDKFGIKY